MDSDSMVKNGDKSFNKLFALVQVIADSAGGMTGKEAAQIAGLPVSTAFRMLKFLEDRGYLFKTGGRYVLGSGFIHLGLRAREQNPLHRLAHPWLEKLAAQTLETVHLATLRGNEVCYYDKVEGRRNVRMGSLIGNFAPVYCTGVGKAILAFLPKAKQDEILNSAHRVRFTKNTLVSLKAIRDDLKKISLCGVAVDDCEHEEGVFCIAAPILDSMGHAIAGISLSGSELYLRGNVKALSKQVLNTACAISNSYNGR